MASSSLLSGSFSDFCYLIKNRWQSYLWYVLLRVLLTVVVLSVMFLVGMHVLVPALTAGQTPTLAIVLVAGTLLVTIFIEWMLQFGVMNAADAKDDDQSVRRLIARGTDRFWWKVGSTLALIFLSSLAFLVFGMIIAFAGAALPDLPLAPVLAALLALFGLYISLPLIFAFYNIILSGEGPIKSFRHMRASISGRWWRLFGTTFVWVLLIGAVLMTVSLFFQFVVFAEVLEPLMELDRQLDAGTLVDPLQAYTQSMTVLSSLMNAQVLASFGLYILIQMVLGILPMYGLLAVYRALEGRAQA